MQPTARRAGPGTAISVVVLVLGLAVGGFGLYAAIAPIVRAMVSSPAFDTPGTVSLHLKTGEYLVYERSGSSGLSFSPDNTTTITPSMVQVLDPSGRSVAVTYHDSSRDTLTRDGSRYVGAVEFHASEAGDYRVSVTTPTANRVVVARSVFDAATKSARWFGLTALGGLIAIGGTVMWVVGAVRRRRQRDALAYAAAVPYPGQQYAPPPTSGAIPAGWYPDPEQPGRQRYWDGSTWTGHVS